MGNTLRRAFAKAIFSLFVVLCSSSIVVLAVTPSVRGTLPSVLRESSGLAYTGGSSFWTHNDGYGDENLYKISNTGSLSRTVEVLGAVNHDWEDLAQDANRNYMYIGDFGNNACDRTDLKIYRITHPSSVSGSTVTAEAIFFTYPDQTLFPSLWMNFDVEAFFHFAGKLYLFTKADGGAIGYTKMYSVPDEPGTYTATLVDSFYTNDRTTSADISPDGTSIILMSNNRLHLFRHFAGDNFFGGQYTKITISGSWTQKEAISFWGNNEIYLCDEDNGAGSKLYSVDMSPWIPLATTSTFTSARSTEEYIIFPNPANTYFTAQFTGAGISHSELKLFDLTGQMVKQVSGEAGISTLRMETATLPAGVYFYKLLADDREVRTARMVITH